MTADDVKAAEDAARRIVDQNARRRAAALDLNRRIHLMVTKGEPFDVDDIITGVTGTKDVEATGG